jgi:hypothetical protein
LRYVSRSELMPYQAKATGRSLAQLDPTQRVVILAMLRVIGGGFLAFGVAALGLSALLWRGERLAGVALTAAAAALLFPAYWAASSIERHAPGAGAPTQPTLAAAAVAAVAFVALLAG